MIGIEFGDGRRNFHPREQLTVSVEWSFPSSPGQFEVRLLWFTSGKGIADTTIVERQNVPDPRPYGRQQFTFRLPESPYSFQGKLIRLEWAVEVSTGRPDECEREQFAMSPTAQEIWIGQPDA